LLGVELFSDSSKYPVYDIGKLVEGKIIPTGNGFAGPGYVSYCINHNVNSGSTCAKIDQPALTESYFPVARQENWESKSEEIYDRSTTIVLYFLAASFLCVSVFGLLCTASFLYTWITFGTIKVQEVLTVVFIFLFNVVRTVHFFLLPTGYESQSGDYALVVLPSFFL
jgi:hypothetical protein